jgi:hypothetical protein
MITVDLRDPMLNENIKAINELRKSAFFTEEELQEMYNKQVEADKKRGETDA